jgi:NAD+ kinase
MQTVALSVNIGRPHARAIATAIAEMARANGVAIAVADEHDVCGLQTPGARLENAEMVLTVGGDGTLLRGVRLAVPLDVPILGVNTGRLGFLTEVETDDGNLSVLNRVFNDDYTVEERVALQASVNGVGAHFALNDVVVRRGAQARVAPFGLSLDGELVAHIPSDGIVVATPTGSTAYFLSAGGPIISPNVDAFGVASLLPHTLFARPLLLPTSSTIEISCDSEIVHANLETDGAAVSDLSSGDKVTIVRGPRPVKFARTGTRGFFMRLEQKLQWGVPIKRG